MERRKQLRREVCAAVRPILNRFRDLPHRERATILYNLALELVRKVKDKEAEVAAIRAAFQNRPKSEGYPESKVAPPPEDYPQVGDPWIP